MAMAREIAKRSLCVRDQVGAIIVDTQNRIIGEGYNGPPAGFRHHDQPCTSWCERASLLSEEIIPERLRKPDYSDCPSLHAEANALMMSDRTARMNGTIYVTSFPCTGCLKLISNSGLSHIYVGVDGEHEYRYREEDYETVRKLGLQIRFEDDRQFETLFSEPSGWCAPSYEKVMKDTFGPDWK